MKHDNKKIEKAQVALIIKDMVKKLKRVKHRVILLDMRDHARIIDKNICDLTKLRRDLSRDE